MLNCPKPAQPFPPKLLARPPPPTPRPQTVRWLGISFGSRSEIHRFACGLAAQVSQCGIFLEYPQGKRLDTDEGNIQPKGKPLPGEKTSLGQSEAGSLFPDGRNPGISNVRSGACPSVAEGPGERAAFPFAPLAAAHHCKLAPLVMNQTAMEQAEATIIY